MLCIVRNVVQMEVHYVGDHNMVLLVNVDLRAMIDEILKILTNANYTSTFE